MSEMIPGYTHGNPSVPKSPISLQEFVLLQKTVLFGAEDVGYLRKSLDVLRDHVEAILDVWYAFVASQPHLLHYFSRKSDQQPDSRYLADVRKRFAQWIIDTAEANYDQKWLDYQFEIGRRHNREAKNRTDQVDAVDHIHLRFVLALFYPIIHTLRPFLAKKGHSSEDVEKMHQAWAKAVLLQVILWSQPYVKDNQF
jgi:hypothetical protein